MKIDSGNSKKDMKAIRIHDYGDTEVLKYENVPIPSVGPDEVLIKINSAGINPLDWKIRRGYLKGKAPYKLPLTLGWDLSGTIEDTGALVTRFKKGDAVFSRPDLSRDGSYAEYIAVHSDEVAHAPATIPLDHAAGIPLTSLTAWVSLFNNARLQAGQSILIHGASGGVGTFAVQLAKLAGAYVIGTTSLANIELVKSLGADEVIDYQSEDFSQKVKNMDAVLDTIGGETLAKSWGVLRKGGILVSVVSKPKVSEARKHGVLSRFTWIFPNGARLEEIAGLVDSGKLKVVIEKEFDFSEVKMAHQMSEGGHADGKIILKIAA